jgi:hypothetical protein
MAVDTRHPTRREPDIMTPPLAELTVTIIEGYVVFGALFALPFVWRGLPRIDPMAVGSSWSFRALIAPGCAIFWPLLLVRWASGSVAPPTEVNAHRRRAQVSR